LLPSSLDLYPKYNNHQPPFPKLFLSFACRQNKIPWSHSFSSGDCYGVFEYYQSLYLWQYGQLGILTRFNLQTPVVNLVLLCSSFGGEFKSFL
jgi:hypothetical protein